VLLVKREPASRDLSSLKHVTFGSAILGGRLLDSFFSFFLFVLSLINLFIGELQTAFEHRLKENKSNAEVLQLYAMTEMLGVHFYYIILIYFFTLLIPLTQVDCNTQLKTESTNQARVGAWRQMSN
jgi:hypothetical protein